MPGGIGLKVLYSQRCRTKADIFERKVYPTEIDISERLKLMEAVNLKGIQYIETTKVNDMEETIEVSEEPKMSQSNSEYIGRKLFALGGKELVDKRRDVKDQNKQLYLNWLLRIIRKIRSCPSSFPERFNDQKDEYQNGRL